jgi:hypothetical protein
MNALEYLEEIGIIYQHGKGYRIGWNGDSDIPDEIIYFLQRFQRR